MSNRDKNYVSFWFWFLALFIAAIPCVGIIMIIIWAFVGDNESRKNYFRAVIAWGVVVFLIWVVAFVLLGLGPILLQLLQHWTNGARPA